MIMEHLSGGMRRQCGEYSGPDETRIWRQRYNNSHRTEFLEVFRKRTVSILLRLMS